MLNKHHNDLKFYSRTAINAATFFGGPLAAGILLRRNFLNLGNERLASNSLIIGIVTTLLVLSTALIPTSHSTDRILNLIFPLFYLGVVNYVTEKYMGPELKRHKAEGNDFYSGWKATKVAILSLLIILSSVFGIIVLMEDDFNYDQYNESIELLYENDDRALRVYSISENEEDSVFLNEIIEVSIPAYLESLELLDKLDQLEGIPGDLLDHNSLLREYCQTQLRILRYLKLSIEESTDEYDGQIYMLNSEIEGIHNKITELQEKSDYFF